MRLLARTTRSVAPTQAGERLPANIDPHFDEIEAALAALSELRDTPAGAIHITAEIMPRAPFSGRRSPRLVPDYPHITFGQIAQAHGK